MKKIGYLLILVFCLVPAILHASDRGEKTIGVLAGYNIRNSAPLAGVSFTYAFNSHFRIAPGINYVFRKDNHDAFIFNLDAQFPFRVSQDSKFKVYPLAGLAYTSHNTKGDDDVSTRTYRFGINAGFGANMNITPTLRLTLEGKYILVRNIPTGQIYLGISYCF